MAQTLSLPRPFVFWTQNGHSSLNFEDRKMYWIPNVVKKNSIFCVFDNFCSHLSGFLVIVKKAIFFLKLMPTPEKFLLCKFQNKKYRVFGDNSKSSWNLVAPLEVNILWTTLLKILSLMFMVIDFSLSCIQTHSSRFKVVLKKWYRGKHGRF